MLAGMTAIQAAAYSGWQKMEGTQAPAKGEQVLVPKQYTLFADDEASLQLELAALPDNPDAGQIIMLPMPDGSVKSFKAWRNTTMDKALMDKYPEIQTYTAIDLKNPRISAKIDWTLRGFHAMIFDGQNTSFVDPYSNQRSGYYIAYYRRDYTRPGNTQMSCLLDGDQQDDLVDLNNDESVTAKRTINGSGLRNYRLALACTGEYAAAVGGATPTKASVLSAMVTTLNRVNGVYERELAISMTLIGNEDTLIFLNGTTDPYSNNSGDSMLDQNQTVVTARIGNNNYDIGHVFSTGGGGIASLGSVCRSTRKAQGVTGLPNPVGDAFDIDYVAHEMGHQYGANHPFNNSQNGSCSGNASSMSAYEPGSGSTIMAYAGICSPDDLQAHSDAYFHAKSLTDIVANITNSTIATCPTTTVSGNKSLSVPSFIASYNIPYKTPFEITAPEAQDSVGNDEKTYCWEQWNLGDFGARFTNTHLRGPIFRSFLPDTSRTRIFPTLTKLLANNTNYLGERLPDTARFLTFKLTTRAVLNGIGTLNISDDTIHLTVINTGTPFVVTAPNTGATAWIGNTAQTVTWDVANTTAAPINCANVDIYLSVDGGHTYPYQLATGVANTGTATINVPNIATTLARIKVKGSGNVFFDISNANFIITLGVGSTGIATTGTINGVSVYPVPAVNELYLSNGGGEKLEISLVNVPGQTVWKGSTTGNTVIPVGQLPRSVYYLRITKISDGVTVVKRIVLE